jgi:CBS domain-containing protein
MATHQLRVIMRDVYSGNGEKLSTVRVFCPHEEQYLDPGECAQCDASAKRSPVTAAEAILRRGDRTRRGARRTMIGEVMSTEVVCVTPDVSVEQVTKLFLERDISGVPVVDAEGRPKGIVSKTDLLRDHEQHGETSEENPGPRTQEGLGYGFGGGFHLAHLASATVEEVMTPVICALDSSCTVAEASALMAFEGIHRLLILSEQGEIVGLISSLDVLRWLAHREGTLVESDGELVLHSMP